MRFFKTVAILFILITIAGLINRAVQLYECYTVVSEDPEHSKQKLKYTLNCFENVVNRGYVPCYYKGCK